MGRLQALLARLEVMKRPSLPNKSCDQMQKCFKISEMVEYVKIVRVKKCIAKPFPGTERQQHKKCFGGLHYGESGERRGRLRDKIVRERDRDM